MKTLILESCNNKANKKPWCAEITLNESGEISYNFLKADVVEFISGTRNRYEFDLKDNQIYCKGDTHNYNNYYVTFFIYEDGVEKELSKREVKNLLA